MPATTFAGRELLCIRGERRVFADLSFDLEPGDALVLLGRNGSGKSSLLRVMAGLLRPAAGVLLRDGKPVADDPEAHGGAARHVGHMDAVKPVLTVAENLTFWANLYGGSSEGVMIALERVGLGHLATLPGKMLSAGQKRRVNLARLLVAPAPLWLLDEPTTALDKTAVAVVESMIAQHRANGGIVVFSTHVDLAVDARPLVLDDHIPANREPLP
ncbi:MAG: heme ABC exporter ATP-binding protein CcmA [Alphaproteobacteria bacterium]|nr:heme ABC exporter ATP-binding protein CcmA [Alphaproteobacteria bacterium]